MRSLVVLPLAALCLLVLAARASAAPPEAHVSLEVLTQPGLPLTASQTWYQVLTDAGISGLRLRSGGSRDKPSVTRQGTAAKPSYHVVGILSSDNVLQLPGGRFKTTDRAKLRQWLDRLRDGGAEGVTHERSAFGLLPSELQEVTDDLKRPVLSSTQDAAAASVVRQIAGTLGYPLQADAAAGRALKDIRIEDELRGMSAGTALAAVLRPAGLGLVPERPGRGTLQYRIAKVGRGTTAWPVGWEPRQPTTKLLPKLYEFLNVEITGIPVSEALTAVAARIEAPMLFDRNAMALHGVDPSQVPAELPSKRISYSQTLRRLLAAAKLRYEVRVDEAERPFMWVTTVKPVR